MTIVLTRTQNTNIAYFFGIFHTNADTKHFHCILFLFFLYTWTNSLHVFLVFFVYLGGGPLGDYANIFACWFLCISAGSCSTEAFLDFLVRSIVWNHLMRIFILPVTIYIIIRRMLMPCKCWPVLFVIVNVDRHCENSLSIPLLR